MNTTPKCDELEEVATCMSDDETVRAWKRLAYRLEENETRLKAALEDIATFAHCTAKAGPLNTPDLAAAWAKFMQINVKASAALASCRKSP